MADLLRNPEDRFTCDKAKIILEEPSDHSLDCLGAIKSGCILLKICSHLFNAFTQWYVMFKLSLVMRKPAFCICENKDADQLRGNREADQRLCFHYMDSTIPLLSKSEISSL